MGCSLLLSSGITHLSTNPFIWPFWFRDKHHTAGSIRRRYDMDPQAMRKKPMSELLGNMNLEVLEESVPDLAAVIVTTFFPYRWKSNSVTNTHNHIIVEMQCSAE